MKNFIFNTILLIGLSVSLYNCESDSGDTGTNFEGTSTSGSLARFTINNSHLYIADESKLHSIDISNKTFNTPKSIYVGSGVQTIFSMDTLLLLGTTTGMLIYDISDNPNYPDYVSKAEHFYSCDPVIAQDTIAYVTLNSGNTTCWRSQNRLQVYNISNIKYPKLIEEKTMDSPLGLGAKNNYLVVADDGLKLYSTTNKERLELLDHLPNIKAHDVIPLKDTWVIAGTDGMKQYKIENDKLVLISQLVKYEK